MALIGSACGGPITDIVTNQRLPSASSREFLSSAGNQFEAAVVPSGVVSADAVVASLRAQGFPPFATDRTVDPPIYGIITCIDSKVCADRSGLVRDPAARMVVWVVDFPRASGGNGGTAWAVVDAATGAFITGDGPPG
jgi:hypothetical protein